MNEFYIVMENFKDDEIPPKAVEMSEDKNIAIYKAFMNAAYAIRHKTGKFYQIKRYTIDDINKMLAINYDNEGDE